MKGQETILDTLNFYSSIIRTELLSIGIIAASAGSYLAMSCITSIVASLKEGRVSRETIDPTLTAYNTSCGEMRSEASRDAFLLCIFYFRYHRFGSFFNEHQILRHRLPAPAGLLYVVTLISFRTMLPWLGGMLPLLPFEKDDSIFDNNKWLRIEESKKVAAACCC
jgi:hypothetical protein